MSRFSTILAFATAIGLSMPALAVPTVFIGNDQDATPASPLTIFPNSTARQDDWLATLTNVAIQDGTLSSGNVSSGILTIPFGTINTAIVTHSSVPLQVVTAATGNGHYSTLGASNPYALAQVQSLTFAFARPISGFGMMITDWSDAGASNVITMSVKKGITTVLTSTITCGTTNCIPTSGQNGATTFLGLSDSAGFFDSITFSATAGADTIGFDQVQVATPEPSSLAVMGFGALALVGSVRRRNRAKADPNPSAHPA